MPAASGRLLVVKKGTTVIIGAKTNTVTVNNEPVDITSKSSAGFRELLGSPGVRSIDIKISGVWYDTSVLESPALTGAPLLTDINIHISDGSNGAHIITGSFYLNSYEVTGEHAGAVEFTATLQSSGPFTITQET